MSQLPNQLNLAALVLRATVGLFLAAHGYNKVFGGGGLEGTGRWFGSIGMRWPIWQARLAASTELGAGLLLAVGLLTPLASAGVIGIMLVAIWVDHRHNGFFIFHKDQGWEYCAVLAITAWAIAIIGPGKWSLDNAFGIHWNGWVGTWVAAIVGVGGAVLQLGVSYRPTKK